MAIRFLNKGNKRAEILLYGEVGPVFWGDEVSAKDFNESLKALGEVDEIDLRINSFGGDVFDGIAIHSQLMRHPAKINSFVDGAAASIASFIAMAGEHIVIAESGMIMIHDAWTIAMGNAEAFHDIADRLEAASSSIASAYIARSGKSEKQIRDWMKEDKEFYGQAAVDAGLADEVAANMQLAARTKPRWEDVRDRLIRDYQDHRRRGETAPEATPNIDGVRDELAARRARLAARKA